MNGPAHPAPPPSSSYNWCAAQLQGFGCHLASFAYASEFGRSRSPLLLRVASFLGLEGSESEADVLAAMQLGGGIRNSYRDQQPDCSVPLHATRAKHKYDKGPQETQGAAWGKNLQALVPSQHALDMTLRRISAGTQLFQVLEPSSAV